MSKKIKAPFIQPGEKDFINSVVKAVLKNDTSREHYLVDDKGIMRYEVLSMEQINDMVELVYENGEPLKVVCVFGKELINDFHFKAGDDELAKPWARKAVMQVIEHGKKVAEKITPVRIYPVD